MGARSSHRVYVVFGDNLFYFVKTFNNLDAYPSICVLPWLHKPSISFFGFEHSFVLWFFVIFLILSDLLAPSMILFNEIIIFFVANFLYMECHWDVLKRIYFPCLEVMSNINKQSLFVW